MDNFILLVLLSRESRLIWTSAKTRKYNWWRNIAPSLRSGTKQKMSPGTMSQAPSSLTLHWRLSQFSMSQEKRKKKWECKIVLYYRKECSKSSKKIKHGITICSTRPQGNWNRNTVTWVTSTKGWLPGYVSLAGEGWAVQYQLRGMLLHLDIEERIGICYDMIQARCRETNTGVP